MEKGFMERFGDGIDHLEEVDVPLVYFFAVFALFFTFRYFLDLFVRGWNFRFEVLLGHVSAGFSLLFFLLIISHFATKENIEKTVKVVVPFMCSLVILITLLDLLIYGRAGFHHGYLSPHGEVSLVRRFFTFFGPLDEISLGNRISFIVGMFFLLVYFFYKSGKLVRSAFFVLLSYSVVFTGLSTSVIVKHTVEILGLEYTISYTLLIRFFLLLSFFPMGAVFYLMRKEGFTEMLKDLRPLGLAHFILMLFLGLGFGYHHSSIDVTLYSLSRLILTVMSLSSAWLFVASFKKTEGRRQMCLPAAFFLAAIYSLAAGYTAFLFIVLFMVIYALKVKSPPLLSKFPIALNSLLLLFLGHSYAGELFEIPVIIPVFFLTLFPLTANFLDIKSYHEDKERGLKTLPVLLGLPGAKLLIGVLFATAVFSSYFLMLQVVYLGPTLGTLLAALFGIFGLIEFYLINTEDQNEKPVFLVYLMLISMITVLMFVL
ncbi:MAG: UbiA family prenyltransferase [Thermoplasmata archaeon]